MLRYFDDIRPGDAVALGRYELKTEELLQFGRLYDPQPFHVDEDAAKDSPFGGLIASGWQTCAIFMRLYVEGVLGTIAGLGSPGVDSIRWLVPVRPGDVLGGKATVVETVPSQKRPDRGTVISECELRNQRDEVVLTMRVRGLVSRRTA